MHDANDAESGDDDFYSGMDSDGDYDYDYGTADYEFMGNEIDDSDDIIDSRGQVLYYFYLQLFWIFQRGSGLLYVITVLVDFDLQV